MFVCISKIVMPDSPRATRWRYLRAISKLCRDGAPARTGEIARLLGVSPASVTEMVKALARDGFVKYSPRRGVWLTDGGLEEVREAAERRSVLQRFFLSIGLGVEEADRQAAMIEAEIGRDSFWNLRSLTEALEETRWSGETGGSPGHSRADGKPLKD